MRPDRLITCLALCCIALFMAGCSSDDNPADPGSGGHTVLLLSDGGSEGHVTKILKASGITVLDGGLFHEFTGGGLTDEVDGVILLNGPSYNTDMNDAGEAALVGFVAQGGGLFVTEWMTYSISDNGFHKILQAVLPVDYAGSYGDGTDTYRVLAEHPITAGVASPFDSPDDSQYSIVAPRSGSTQLVRGGRSGAAITTWEVPGRVVHWNGTGAYQSEDVWNANIDKLITNSAHYICAGNRKAAPIETVSMQLSATALDITYDGDASSQGDFYITVRLSTIINGKSYDVANLAKTLVQGSDGQNIPLSDIVVTAELPLIDGFSVITRVSFYENDPGGPQASVGRANTFVYDAASGCWARTSDQVCVQPGGSKNGSLILQDFSGSALDADLYWRFAVAQP